MSTTAATSVAKPISIRAATLDDADAIFGLLAQLEKGDAPERPAFEAAYASNIRNSDDHLLLVATDHDGKVTGYAFTTLARLFHTNGIAAHLQELVVDEASRGQRVGTALVGAVERECRALGVRQLTVASRRGAAFFYEGLDYRSTADYLKKSFDASV
ncbi:GNAT superfamily N-acetyltransferase [Marisediminicola sp. UYEF4]|uniref:GNAT family N-acetyltransferase n=1 Tax=Marisediminicola sp. UYEF4 TaxID=1756384 RepID=UPI0033999B33